MEIIGSVEPQAVPEGRRSTRGANSVWAALARRAMMDHEQGRVTVVKLADQAEYKKMRNGIQPYLRVRKYHLNPVILEQPDGLRVFMELQPLEASGSSDGLTTEQGGTSVGNPDSQARRSRRATA